ncbi:MAG: type II secretion system protein [Myxococcales bacterium]|nr:MAG: type II secretion system protein [Myxococcales bacterium]
MKYNSGFTLLELLIAVSIIGGSAALAAPAIGTAMAERRVAQAQLDALRIGRQARSEALALGTAHLLRFTKASNPDSLGMLRLYRGSNSGCNTTDWSTITSGTSCTAPNCVAEVNLGDSKYRFSATNFVQMEGSPDEALVDLCYTSSGMLWHRIASTAPFSDQNNTNGVSGGYAFWFQGKLGTAFRGVRRWAVFPLGGAPRVMQ